MGRWLWREAENTEEEGAYKDKRKGIWEEEISEQGQRESVIWKMVTGVGKKHLKRKPEHWQGAEEP